MRSYDIIDSTWLNPQYLNEIGTYQRKLFNDKLTERIKIIWNLIKTEFKELTETTITHGMPNKVRNKSNLVSLTWTVCFFVSLGYWIDQLVISIPNNKAYVILNNYNLIYEVPSQFPAVDICNLNPYDGNIVRVQIENIKWIYNCSGENNVYYIEKLNLITQNLNANLEKNGKIVIAKIIKVDFIYIKL